MNGLQVSYGLTNTIQTYHFLIMPHQATIRYTIAFSATHKLSVLFHVPCPPAVEDHAHIFLVNQYLPGETRGELDSCDKSHLSVDFVLVMVAVPLSVIWPFGVAY